MIKTTIKEKYEKYIGTLRETISKFQGEWDILYESYQNLLADIKGLIITNEKLKSMVIDEIELDLLTTIPLLYGKIIFIYKYVSIYLLVCGSTGHRFRQ